MKVTHSCNANSKDAHNVSSRCFIPAAPKLWNELPSMIMEAAELQKFKHGCRWTVVCFMSLSFFKYFLYFADFLF